MPNGGYDGSIRIKVDAETDRAMTKIQNLEAKLRRQTEAMDRQANRVSDLKSKYDKLASGDVMPRSLGAMERKLQDAQREAAALEMKMQELGTQQEFALGMGDAGRAKALELEIERLGQQLIAAEDAAAKLRGEINAIKMNPASSEEAQKVKRDLEAAERTLARMRDESARTGETLRRTVVTQADDAAKKLETLSQRAKKARDSVQSMGKASKGLGILSGKLGDILNRLKNIAISALVMSAAYKGFRALADYLSGAVKANREFSASLAQVKGNLLTAFQPIYNAIMPALNALMSAVARATAYIAAFVNMLFGKSVAASAAGAKSLYAQAKGFGAAGKAAKEAGKSFAAFDEINQLIIDEAEGGGGGGVEMPEFGDTADMSGLLGLWEKLKGVIQEIADIFMTGFWEGFGEFDFWRLQTDLSNIGDTLKRIFTDPEVLSAAKRYFESIVLNAGRIVGSITSIGLSIGQALVGGIEESLSEKKPEIKAWLVRMFNINTDIEDIKGNLSIAMAKIAESLESEDGEGIVKAFSNIFIDATTTAGELCASFGREILNIIAQPVIENSDKIKTAFENAFWVLEPIFNWVSMEFNRLCEEIKTWYYEKIKPFMDGIAKDTSLSWGAALDIFNANMELIKQLLNGQKLDWGSWRETIDSTVKSVVDNIKKKLEELVESMGFSSVDIEESLNGLLDFFSNVFAGQWDEAWASIEESTKASVNNILTFVENLVNGAIEKINELIGNLNGAIDLINKIPSVNIGHIGEIDKISIPRLAAGAVIPPRQEFMAILGDQRSGTNIEAPLSTIEDAVRSVLAEQGGGQQQDITINFTGNMAQLARALKPHLDAESVRRGTSLVMGVS